MSEGMWLHLPPDKSLAPRPVRLTGAAAAIEWAVGEVHAGKRRASKDRVDLVALALHCGTSYAQVETVPKALFETVRETQANVVALVLLPPGAGGSSVAGGDAVVLFYDATGALKGLPPNGRADMLAAASGLAGRHFYGEAVLARLVHGTDSLSLGENRLWHGVTPARSPRVPASHRPDACSHACNARAPRRRRNIGSVHGGARLARGRAGAAPALHPLCTSAPAPPHRRNSRGCGSRSRSYRSETRRARR